MDNKDYLPGGAAFPAGFHPQGNQADQFGMSLRDFFAAAALTGIMAGAFSNPECAKVISQKSERFGRTEDEFLASCAFNMADAMLKVRSTPAQEGRKV